METTFLERLKQEKKELQEKFDKLTPEKFMGSNVWYGDTVSQQQRNLLGRQAHIMEEYLEILILRIYDLENQ